MNKILDIMKNMEYGEISNIKLHKYIWQNIIDVLPQTEWYKLKSLNKSFYNLIKQSCIKEDTRIEYLIKNNLLESVLYRIFMEKIDINQCLKLASLCGSLETAKLLIKNSTEQPDYDTCFEYSCLMGHIKVVQLMIRKGINNWNKGLITACQGGHMDIVILMIDNGATHWNVALQMACYKNNKQLVDLIIHKGANHCFNCGQTIDNHLS